MKKRHLFLFGILTVLLSVAFSWIMSVRIAPVTADAEFFIGLMVAILGLLITFVVGFQIYNAFEAKETLKEIGELKNVKKELDNFKHQIRAEHKNAMGVNAHDNGEYLLAICYYMGGLYYSLKCDDMEMADMTINNAWNSISEWEAAKSENQFECSIIIGGKHPKDATIKYINDIISEFKDDKLYKVIEKRFLDVKRQVEEKIAEHEAKPPQ